LPISNPTAAPAQWESDRVRPAGFVAGRFVFYTVSNDFVSLPAIS
jgi:hypothetical protein